MKAITLTQPWASLVALGAKRIETRSWNTNYRGPLAIHAAKGLPKGLKRGQHLTLGEFDTERDQSGLLMRADRLLWPYRLPLGSVVAICELIDVLPITEKPQRGERCVALDEEGRVRLWKPGEFEGVAMHVGEACWSSEREDGWTAEHEAAFGDYEPGRFAWLLADVRPIRRPIATKGALGLWEWPAEVTVF